jgi:hypothetical protein
MKAAPPQDEATWLKPAAAWLMLVRDLRQSPAARFEAVGGSAGPVKGGRWPALVRIIWRLRHL